MDKSAGREDPAPTMTPQAPTMTPQEMQAALAAEREQRAQACLEEINRVLKAHGCTFQPQPYVTPDGRLAARVAVVALDNAE